jgi:Cytochrome P460
MSRRFSTIAISLLAAAAVTAVIIYAPPAAPASAGDETLQRPPDLRELVFLSSSHGLAYGPAARALGSPAFTNIFVAPQIYKSFMQTGQWPQGTTFFMEVRKGESHTDIGTSGSSQGELLAVEAEKKDSTRYPDGGWAFFDFGPGGANERGQPIPRTADCYTCHRLHGAVEQTFTQFYPEQFAVAKRMGTVRKDYDPTAKLK